MCDPPEQFNLDYFFNKGLLTMKDGEFAFYEVGKTEATVKVEGGGATNPEKEGWRRKIGEVRNEMGEIRGGMGTITSALMELKGALEVHTEKMTEAVTLMMRMVTSVEQRNSQAQQIIPQDPVESPDSLPLEKPAVQQAPINPATIPSKKRKEITTKPTTTVSVKKSVEKQAVKENE